MRISGDAIKDLPTHLYVRGRSAVMDMLNGEHSEAGISNDRGLVIIGVIALAALAVWGVLSLCGVLPPPWSV
jgi:hypothetical protein